MISVRPAVSEPVVATPPPGSHSWIGTYPFAASVLVGCAPQKCYVDDIASYSTNEVAINWNAPLAWAAAFLDGAGKLQSHDR